jgi:glycosyltransferase involved in cell wall biosynthesis
MLRILAITNLYPTPQRPSMGTFVEQQIVGLRRIGLDVDVMFVDRRERGMGSYLTMRTELRSHIKHFQPHLVHVMYGGILAEEATRACDNMPIIVSFCGSDLLGQHLSGAIRSIISECGVLASHLAARRASGVVVKSRNLEEALPATVDRSKVRIIPNGIDLKRFRPLEPVDCRKKLGWSSDKFHVLFPANSGDPCKRPYLAQAAIDTANRSGLNAELHQLRGVAHEDVPIWLNASDVVLLTSLHEGSPNVIKEALACDVPIVSVDVGDVSERLSGAEGCHIALPDSCDLGAKLCLVRSRKGRIAGREKVQHLSLEHTCLNLRDFYLQVLESHEKQGIMSRLTFGPNALLDFFSSIIARRRKFRRQPKER